MHITPPLEQFTEQYCQGKGQLLYTSLPADLETPVSALLRLQAMSDWHFLLESVQDGERQGRYSIIGIDTDILFAIQDGKAFQTKETINYAALQPVDNVEALDSLQQLIDQSRLPIPDHLPPMASGLFGYMGYDCVRLMEDIPDNNPDNTHIPESVFIRPKVMVIFDAVKAAIHIICPVWSGGEEASASFAYIEKKELISQVIRILSGPLSQSDYSQTFQKEKPIDFISNCTQEQYHQMVNQSKEYIKAGDIFQVVPSQRFRGDFSYSALSLYRSLRHMNPSPYLFMMHLGDFSLIGSSPEILLRVEDGQVTGRPIAGTRKRGHNKGEDEALKKDLLADPKECAEHLMLLDLGRNDIGRVAKVGTVSVKEQFVIELYSHVMHIVSEVQGELREDCSVTDAIKATFPVGTVSGAPKIRAMEIIDELESEKRSFYAGGVGYISSNGQVDLCIALRTALLKEGVLHLQAGGGVVADSDPEAEYQETLNKAKALMRAAEHAYRFEA